MQPSNLLTVSIAVISALPPATCITEWFGDARAQLNPPKAPPFYDVVYDDPECKQGIESNAIPEYVYFGEMVGSRSVEGHADCLEYCLNAHNCKAVNFFAPLSIQEKGFCELLKETQLDNPRLMRPFRKATYFENIRCRSEADLEADLDPSVEADSNGKDESTPTTTSKPVKAEPPNFLKKLSSLVSKFNMQFAKH
ncbi:PAN-1 domain containing protein [Aphelenchoides avenae]|nr:PAN-1 domain containing protein [Aphelenchus avenae]